MKLFSFLVIAALMLGPVVTLASSDDSLVISQVQVSGAGGANDEFVEIANQSNETVNLSGWSVQYKSSTGSFPLISRKVLPDFDLLPGKYFLIGHNSYSGTVAADLIHSAFALSGSAAGATIFLSKSTDYIASADDANLVDRLAYGTSESNSPEQASALLPESGKSLQRIADEDNNSTDFVVGDSQPRNSAHLNEEVEENPAESDPEEIEPENGDEPEEPIVYPEGVIISEIMANPEGMDTGEEWIELYNTSSSTINLDGWILDDSITDEISNKHLELGDLEIESGKPLIVVVPEGKFALNNTSEEQVQLYWPNKKLVNTVTYAGPVKEEQTWCLIGGGFQWCKPTPSKANAVLEAVKAKSKETPKTEDQEDKEDLPDYSKYEISLIELLPDPDGADTGNEVIKLANIGTTSIQLEGWILDDGLVGDAIGSSAYKLDAAKLNIGEELEVTIPAGKFAMNNSGSDTIRLFSPDKKLKDHVTYDEPDEGILYIKSGKDWAWNGQVLGEDTAASSLEDELPRTGMNIHMFSFASLVGIWYIVYGFRIMKGIHEQTRSHRCLSS